MGTVSISLHRHRIMLTCFSLLTISLVVVNTIAQPVDVQEAITSAMSKQKRSLHVEVLPSAPLLGDAWEEVENPEFLLVREAPDKRSRGKRSRLCWLDLRHQQHGRAERTSEGEAVCRGSKEKWGRSWQYREEVKNRMDRWTGLLLNGLT